MVKIALDDFGTGYSSLSYLRSLSIDTLKIDRSFVAKLHENEQKAAIIKTVYELATQLKLSVVAEGVEEIEELNFLNNIGDMAIQGFLLARPMPAERAMHKYHNITTNRVWPAAGLTLNFVASGIRSPILNNERAPFKPFPKRPRSHFKSIRFRRSVDS